jgi:hypothetical protein
VSDSTLPSTEGSTLDAPPTSTLSRLSVGLATGIVTAAAIVGTLLGLGRRSSTLWRPLNAVAHTILGERADGVWEFHADVTLTGCLVVLVVSLIAGVVTAWLTSSRRILPGAIAACGVALAGYFIHVHVVARTPGGLAALLSVGELRALYMMGAIALAGGMRYAFSPVAEAMSE